MEYYLPDELVLIGCRHRIDSKQPGKNCFLGRGRTSVPPLFRLQEDRTGTNEVMFDGDDITVDGRWTHFAHSTLLLCRGMGKRLSFVVIWLARPKILDGTKHDFVPRNGTNGHEQPRSVPSGSTRSNRVKTRPKRLRTRHR